MKKFLIALLISFVICRSTVFANENLSMTLDDAINLALKNNRLIEQSEEDREYARLELSAIRKKAGPTLTWHMSSMRIGGRFYNQARSLRYKYRTMDEKSLSENNIDLDDYPPYKSSNSNTLALTIPLYGAGQIEGQRKSAGYGLNSADLNLENTRQLVKFQTSQAYYQVLQSKNIMNVRQEAINLLSEHLRIVQDQYDVGNVAMADVITTKVQIANSRQEYNTARIEYEKSVANLNNIIGLPVDTPLIATDELQYLPYEQSEMECLEYALNHRPDGIASIYEVKRVEESVNSAKTGFRPNISAIIQGEMTGEGVFKADQSKERWAAGIQLSWNIFDNNLTNTQIAQAKSAQRKAESVARQQLEQIRLEVHNAYIGLKIAGENITITTDALRQAKEKFSIAQIRYSEGEDENLLVMNAQEKLTEANTNYFNALYLYNMSKAELNKAMGLPIEIDPEVYFNAVESGKNASTALKESSILPSTIFDENGKIKKRSESDIKAVRISETEILNDESVITCR